MLDHSFNHIIFMKRNVFYIFIACITLCAVIMFGVTLKNAVIAAPVEPEAPMPVIATSTISTGTTSHSVSSNTSYPERLIIPSLGINANVQHVGISIHGTMAVPNNYTDIGWYRYGTVPGQAGNAVFAGHLDNGLALPGVFKHLADIKLGDEIDVVAQNGKALHFYVTGTSTLDYNTQETDSVFSDGGDSQVKLITCEGTWDQSHKTYSNRLVVTARLSS